MWRNYDNILAVMYLYIMAEFVALNFIYGDN